MIDSLLDLLDSVLIVLYGIDPFVLALATAGFTALETTALVGLVVPGDAAVLIAGSTVNSPGRFVLIASAAAIGTYSGELIGYVTGRAVGPRLRISRLGRFLGEHRWSRAERYLAGRGAAALVPARFVAVLHAVAPLLAGMVRMPFRKFALWAGTGAVLWSVTYTALGTAIGAAYREYRGLGLLITLAVIAISAAVVFGRRLLSRARPAPDVELEPPIPAEATGTTALPGRGAG